MITATGSGGLDAESTLTYNASILNVISTTQGLGLNLRNTSNEYTRIIFDAARTGASSALGILEGKWNNGNSVCQIYLQSGDDTTNKDDGRISMVVNSAAGSNKTAFRIEPDASVQLPNDSQRLQFGNDQDLSIWHGGSNGYIDNETGNLSIRTTSSNTTRMFIKSDGNIGIGTDNPNHELTIFGDTPNIRLSHTGSTNTLNVLYTQVDGTGVEWNSYQDGTGTRRPFIFKQYTTEVFRIESDGRVQIAGQNPIATTSLTHRLLVRSQNDSHAIAIAGRNGDHIGELTFYQSDASTRMGEIQAHTTHLEVTSRLGYLSLQSNGPTERVRISTNELRFNSSSQ